MSDEESKVQSEEEETTETPKKGRGRPKKGDTPASASAEAAGAGGGGREPSPEEQRIPVVAVAVEEREEHQQQNILLLPPLSPSSSSEFEPAVEATAVLEFSTAESQEELGVPGGVPLQEITFTTTEALPPPAAAIDAQFLPLAFPSEQSSLPSSELLVISIDEEQQQQQQVQHQPQLIEDCEFQPSQNFQFAASDFDFLLSKGGGGTGAGGGGGFQSQSVEPPRDSLLLKFDPLLKAPVASSVTVSSSRLSPTTEELEPSEDNVLLFGCSPQQQPSPIIIETAPAAGEAEVNDIIVGASCEEEVLLTGLEEECGLFTAASAISPTPSSNYNSNTSNNNISMMNVDDDCVVEMARNSHHHCADEEDEKMSVDNTMIVEEEEEEVQQQENNVVVVAVKAAEANVSYMEPDHPKDFNSSAASAAAPSPSPSSLDKKSKNESLKIEELEKKLADAELREETLLKRITDKDKTISKMSGVVEAYERAIAELIAEKEQTTQNYEKMCEALKADSDINAQHLESLEKTFSDLHAKYERMKVVTGEYKEREEELVNERNRFEESLRMQEKRYENMKSHAMTQLEIANNKLSDLVRNHAQEVTKLKALLKKEEIYRASVNEQLSQKSRENEELVKICEELINGGAN